MSLRDTVMNYPLKIKLIKMMRSLMFVLMVVFSVVPHGGPITKDLLVKKARNKHKKGLRCFGGVPVV